MYFVLNKKHFLIINLLYLIYVCIQCIYDTFIQHLEPRSPQGHIITPLHQLLKKRGYNLKDKLLYDTTGIKCGFCHQIGHSTHACMLRETVPDIRHRSPYVDKLMDSDKIQTATYQGLSLEEAKRKLFELGSALNANNPWKDSTNPRHAIRAKLGFWKAIGANKQVISWHGYGLPANRFQITPDPVDHHNPASYAANTEWATQEINRQIAVDRYQDVDPSFPIVIHPTDVKEIVKPDGTIKRRRVDVAIWANAHQASHQHKMETAKSLSTIVRPNSHSYVVDLKDCYYQYNLAPEARPYACFRNGTRLLSSKVLLMGMKPASMWVSKSNAPILQFFRALELACSAFIDDWFGSDNIHKAEYSRQFMMYILALLGLTINTVKSSSCPSPTTLYIGFDCDTVNRIWKVPAHKILLTLSMINTMLHNHVNRRPATVATLRTLIGKLASFTIAIPTIQLWLMHAHKQNNQNLKPSDLILISNDTAQDLQDIITVLNTRNGNHFSHSSPNFVLAVDAGETGIGCLFSAPNQIASQHADPLPTSEIGTSSTRRELIAANTYLRLHGPEMASKATQLNPATVKLNMDSQPGIKAIIKGHSSTPAINEALKILETTRHTFNLRLHPNWIPRDKNKIPDNNSKIWASTKTLTLRHSTLVFLANHFGTHTTLIFPEYGTLPWFFRQRESFINKNPPTILIHPIWPKQTWWPALLRLSSQSVMLGTYDQFDYLMNERQSTSTMPNWNFAASFLPR